MNAIAAQLIDRLGAKAHVSHHRYTSGHETPDHLGLLDTAFQLHRLAACLLEDPAGVLDRGDDSQLERQKWHVGHEQRRCTARPTISAW